MSAQQQAGFFRSLCDVWETGKVESLDELLPADVAYHLPPFGDMDREGLKQFVAGFHQAFPDFSLTIDQEIRDGDTGAARWRCTGTFTGTSPLWPVAPTGKAVAVSGGHFVAWRDERPLEVWHHGDWMGGLQQCGVLPPLG